MTESGLVIGISTHGFTMNNVIVDDFREGKDFPDFVAVLLTATVDFPC